PADARDHRRAREPLGGKTAMRTESTMKPQERTARLQIRYEADEVASVGVAEAKTRRVTLAARKGRVIAEHLERQHDPDVVSARPRRARINDAAHQIQ